MRIYVTEKDTVTPGENNLVNLICENGVKFESLEPRRLFPVSNLERYITLLNTDGEEVAVIREISGLSEESAKDAAQQDGKQRLIHYCSTSSFLQQQHSMPAADQAAPMPSSLGSLCSLETTAATKL